MWYVRAHRPAIAVYFWLLEWAGYLRVIIEKWSARWCKKGVFDLVCIFDRHLFHRLSEVIDHLIGRPSVCSNFTVCPVKASASWRISAIVHVI